MGDPDLRDRLRRLGISQGIRDLAPKTRPRGRAIEDLLAGEAIDTDHGSFFLYRERYGPDHHHGHHSLADLLAHPPHLSANLARDDRLSSVDFRRIAFVDTETTGLAGGTGTYAFLVGVGVFDEEGFTVHQYFMRDYDEEPAQLQALGALLDGLEAVVSFNGKSFDMPLLETRFIMNHQLPRLSGAPHLDLLPPARRFWKYRLQSCALSSLEAKVLGITRTQADVPGWLIPSLYADYARTGDAHEMPRIFYHNAQDILSLVTLTAQMCDLLAAPLPSQEAMPGDDLYGLGRFLHELGDTGRAEMAYAQAALSSPSRDVHEMAMRDLAALLKRQERREEALPWWERLVEEHEAVYACEELAKHFEWHDPDPARAMSWTLRALTLVESWSPGPAKRQALAELLHRLQRLEHKLQT
jgi:uncharacterized protein YprB with RNaseH-like and TPR domain